MAAFSPIPLPLIGDRPLVSVLVSNYNYGRYIGEAVESVLSQSYSRLELIICDDGSTDESRDVIERYSRQDSRVKPIFKENGGQASGYNRAFQSSQGDVVCFLDSDDIYVPVKLERVVESFRANPSSGFAGHKLIRVDQHRRPLGISPLLGRMPAVWQGESMWRDAGFLEYLAPGGGLSLRREVAERIFPLPEAGALSRYGDAPLMRLAPLMTPLIAIDEGLAEWRCHGSNFSNRQTITPEYLRRELMAYQDMWNLQRTFLETNYCADVAARLAALETNGHVLQMRYMLAKLERGHALPMWRQLMRRRRLASKPDRWLRYFWLFSILLPRQVFSFGINLLAGPNRIKAGLARLALNARGRNTFSSARSIA